MGHQSPNHDSKGRFAKGNKAAAGCPEIRKMKTAVKEEIIKCAHSLLRPYATLKEENESEGLTRYQYLVNKAINEGNTKLITWLTEMAVGKPKSDEGERGDGDAPVWVPLPKDYQESLLDMALEARKRKVEKDKKRLKVSG